MCQRANVFPYLYREFPPPPLEWLNTGDTFQLCLYRNVIAYFFPPTGNLFWTWVLCMVTNSIFWMVVKSTRTSNIYWFWWLSSEIREFILCKWVVICFYAVYIILLLVLLTNVVRLLLVEWIAEVGTALVLPELTHGCMAMAVPYDVGHCWPLTSANRMKRANYSIAVVHPCTWSKPGCNQLFWYIKNGWWLQKQPSLEGSRVLIREKNKMSDKSTQILEASDGGVGGRGRLEEEWDRDKQTILP